MSHTRCCEGQRNLSPSELLKLKSHLPQWFEISRKAILSYIIILCFLKIWLKWSAFFKSGSEIAKDVKNVSLFSLNHLTCSNTTILNLPDIKNIFVKIQNFPNPAFLMSFVCLNRKKKNSCSLLDKWGMSWAAACVPVSCLLQAAGCRWPAKLGADGCRHIWKGIRTAGGMLSLYELCVSMWA